MKELVRFLAQQLVNNPDAVEVTETRDDSATLLELRVAKEDLGRVIGKQGRTANRFAQSSTRSQRGATAGLIWKS